MDGDRVIYVLYPVAAELTFELCPTAAVERLRGFGRRDGVFAGARRHEDLAKHVKAAHKSKAKVLAKCSVCFKAYTYKLKVLGTLLILSLGIVLGWNSPIVLLLSSPDSRIHDNKLNIATLTAFLSAGQMLAPVINVLVIDKIGRKNTILLCGFPLVASWSIILMTRSAYVSFSFLLVTK
ncbi:hypothetical protein M0804_014587 [Polistes exclamans]|nr:hypothetical protein M0804_014587 [Polistes exclamans]